MKNHSHSKYDAVCNSNTPDIVSFEDEKSISDDLGGGARPRLDWVDALRALAMLLVIYGHRVSDWIGYFVFTSPIKIPLFFAITGYIFSGGSGDTKLFFRKLFRTIIVPWLVLAIVPYLVATPIKGLPFLWRHVRDILVGADYWYMPCCITAEIFWFFILKSCKKTWQVAVSSLVLFTSGLAIYSHQILSVFMINRAMTVQVFLFIGWLLKKYEEHIMEKFGKVWALVVGGCIYLGLGILSLTLYPGEVIDVHLCEYYNHFICQLMIWIGIYSLFILASKYIRNYPKCLLLIGQNSLVIYMLHSFATRVWVKVFSVLHLPVNRLTNMLLTAGVCAICLLISILINRFLPELMGKKRKS